MFLKAIYTIERKIGNRMNKFKRSLAALLILLLVANILPLAAFAVQVYDFPLRALDNKLIADANTRYITLVKQDPQSKLITVTVQIQHNGTGTEKLAIQGFGVGIFFDDRVAPYKYNPSQSTFDSSLLFPGGRLRPENAADNKEFLKYVKPLISDFDTIGSALIQRDSAAKMLGLMISSGDPVSVPALIVSPGQTLDILECYFMPVNGTDPIDINMISYSYFFESFPAVIRVAPTIMNGTYSVQATGQHIPLTDTYIVNPNTFKLHIRRPVPVVSADNDTREVVGYDPDIMEWSDTASGGYISGAPVIGNAAQTVYVRIKGDDSYSGADARYGDYRKYVTGLPAQVDFEAAGIPHTPEAAAYVRKVGENKTSSDGKTRVGDVIDYTITVRNIGDAGSIWANTVLTDTISSYVTLDQGSIDAPSGAVIDYNATTKLLTVTLGDIAVGDSKVITFSVTVNDNAYDKNITNGVTVSGKDGQGSTAKDLEETVLEDDDRTVEPDPNAGAKAVAFAEKVGVNKTSSDGKTRVGDEIEYTITVRNDGPNGTVWANVVLTDAISMLVSLVPGSIVTPAGINPDYDSDSRILTVNLGDIEAGVAKTVKFNVTVNEDAYGQNITNSVVITGKESKDDDADGLNKTVEEEGGRQVEDQASYTVSFSVDGDIVSSQSVKEGAKAIRPAADPEKPGYTFDGWRLGSITGALYDFDTLVTANITLFASWIRNYVKPDPSQMEVTKVGVNKTSTDGKTRVGDRIEYTITVENIGAEDSVLANVELFDEINAYVTLDEFSVSVGYSISTSRVLYVSLGDIEAGQKKEVTFTVTVNADAYGKNITNGVTVRAKDGIDDDAEDIEEEVEEDDDRGVEDDRFVVSFNVDGQIVSTQKVAGGGKATRPTPDPAKAGFNFNSWRLNSVTGAVYDFDAPVTSNITLFASWTAVKRIFTVTFYAGANVYQVAEVEEGSAVTEPVVKPEKVNYTFRSWRLGSEDGQAYNFSTPVNSNIALYASWTYNGGTPIDNEPGGTHTGSTSNNNTPVTPVTPPPVVTIPNTPPPLASLPPAPVKKIEDDNVPLGNLPKTSVIGSQMGASSFMYYLGALGVSIFLLKKDEEDSE